MGTIAISALYGGIGDSVQGTELLRRIPNTLNGDFEGLVGSCDFMDTLSDESGVSVDVESVSVDGAISRLLFELRTFVRLLRIRRPEAVFLRFRILGFGPMLYAKLKDVPVVLHLDGFPELEYSGTRINDAAMRISKPFDRMVINGADSVVLPSGVARQGLERCYGIDDPDLPRVIPNGADLERFRPMDGEECRRALGLPDGRIVLFFGAIEKWQGIDELIAAFCIMRELHPDLSLVIVGGGTMAEDLKLSEGVQYRGIVPSEDIPRYINAADVTVAPIPVDRLAFPMKVLESLACGVPALVTRNESTRELEEVAPALLLDDNGIMTIACALERVLYGSDGRGIGAMGRRYVTSRYSWDRSARMFSRELDHIAAEGRVRRRSGHHPVATRSGKGVRTSVKH